MGGGKSIYFHNTQLHIYYKDYYIDFPLPRSSGYSPQLQTKCQNCIAAFTHAPEESQEACFDEEKSKLLLKYSPTTLKSNLIRETTSLFVSLSSPQFPGIVFWNVNGAWMAQGAALNPVVPIGPQHPFGPTGVGQGRSSASAQPTPPRAGKEVSFHLGTYSRET